EAGVAMETYSAEHDELEHLVQRERGVVWADQSAEESGQEEVHTTDPASCLQPLMAFSHLISHKNTPCSEYRSPSLSHTLTHTFSLSPSLTHNHTHTFSLSLTHTHTHFLSLSQLTPNSL